MKERSVKEIGIVGLGKMGSAIASRLIGKGWRVFGYNRSLDATRVLVKSGLFGTKSLQDLIVELETPRIIWIMLPAGKAVDEFIDKLSKLLDKGDVIIDGGNSFYKDSVKHYNELSKKEIEFVDVGVSGGPEGARHGVCLMVGGKKKLYDYLLPLYIDMSVPKGHQHFKGSGAGHFVKMVHNGIEYGMMQAIAEGFDLMKNSEYKLNLKKVARVYNSGSVIESRLIGWMVETFEEFGDELKEISGSAGSGGTAGMAKSEAKWTSDVAKELGIEAKVIEESINARIDSQKKASFQGKIINSLRNRFGGHDL